MKDVLIIFLIILCLCHSETLLSSVNTTNLLQNNTGWKEEIWEYRKINHSKFPEARCLDGTPPAFFYRPGTGSGVDKFHIHHESGGWCTNLHDCYHRSNNFLGSTDKLPLTNHDLRFCTSSYRGVDGEKIPRPCFFDGYRGLMSSDPETNPVAHNWNSVYIRYCDGGSYAGNVKEPVTMTSKGSLSKKLFFRGKAILDAVYDTLLEEWDLKKAKEVMIVGTSAGGLSIFLHLDYLKDKITKSSSLSASSPPVRVIGVSDGGYFVNYPSIKGIHSYTPHFKNIFYMQNIATTVNQKCIKHYSSLSPISESSGSKTIKSKRKKTKKKEKDVLKTEDDQTWKCFMAEYLLPFIETDLFIVNSLIDNWSGSTIMDLNDTVIQDCFYPENAKGRNCSENVKTYLQQFRQSQISRNSSLHHYLFKFHHRTNFHHHLAPSAASRRGGWFLNCWTHVMLYYDDWWSEIKSNGYTMKDTFSSWYNKNTSSAAAPWVVIDRAKNGREFRYCV
jgi:hypothetical protein